MPSNLVGPSLRKHLSVLAIPGMYLVYKYTQYRRQQQDTNRKKTAEKELQCLNNKIDKLLNTLDDNEQGALFTEEEECVVCLCAKATMQTFPCGHRVVCRKCFVKTIQVAVSQRCLPLRCVVCRTRISKLSQSRDISPLTPSRSSNHNLMSPGHKSKGRTSRSSSLARQFFRGGGTGGGGGGGGSGTPSSHYQSSKSANIHHNSSSDRSGHGHHSKPVATKLMQPLLIFPPADNNNNADKDIRMPSVTALRNEDEEGSKKKKKHVRFASPIRCRSPSRQVLANLRNYAGATNEDILNNNDMEGFVNVDIISSGGEYVDIIGTIRACDNAYQPIPVILKNTAETRIPTIKYGDCFSPRLARCYARIPRKSAQDSVFGSPRLVMKECK